MGRLRRLSKLLERKDLTGVIVCPCDHHHVHASILACQAGLDVYVEKPPSTYLAEGRALVKAARNTSGSCRRARSSGPWRWIVLPASWSATAASAR